MAPTVDARLPLSLLEAVRDIDTPESDPETEFVPELRNKRLGLSETVYAQIRRYSEAVKRDERSSYDEAVALARLIGRRPDAEVVFRVAGEALARGSYVTVAAVTRGVLHAAPRILSRRMVLSRVRKFARRYLNGTITYHGNSVQLDVAESVTADATSDSTGCSYYAASLGEMLHLLAGTSAVVEHVRCSARGEGGCQWQAEWAP